MTVKIVTQSYLYECSETHGASINLKCTFHNYNSLMKIVIDLNINYEHIEIFKVSNQMENITTLKQLQR